MTRSIILILLLLSSLSLQAQQTLLIKKFGGNRRYEFIEGEVLRLKLKDSREVLSGSWQYAGKQVITVDGQLVELSNIRWLDVSKKEKGVYVLRKGQDLLLLAGLGYFTVSHMNVPLDTGEFGLDREASKDSGILVAGGLLCSGLDRLLHRRKLPVNSNRFSISLIR